MGIFRRKISIIGSGFTGTATALMLAQKEIGDIVLVDIPQLEAPAKGKALDIHQAMSIQQSNVTLTGTADYNDTKDSDVVVITAGSPRKQGVTRDQLLTANIDIVKSVAKQVAHHSPDCIIIVLTNPVDIMTHVVMKASSFPKSRVIGQSGVLDSGRLALFVSQLLNVSIEDVSAIVIGGHNDNMVPLIRYSNVSGIPLDLLLTKEQLHGLIKRTQHGGAEIFDLMGSGSYIAPAASLTTMVETILKDKKRIMPVSLYLEGEYGFHGICLGVPALIGGKGAEKIFQLPLNKEERQALDLSAATVIKLMASLSPK